MLKNHNRTHTEVHFLMLNNHVQTWGDRTILSSSLLLKRLVHVYPAMTSRLPQFLDQVLSSCRQSGESVHPSVELVHTLIANLYCYIFNQANIAEVI